MVVFAMYRLDTYYCCTLNPSTIAYYTAGLDSVRDVVVAREDHQDEVTVVVAVADDRMACVGIHVVLLLLLVGIPWDPEDVNEVDIVGAHDDDDVVDADDLRIGGDSNLVEVVDDSLDDDAQEVVAVEPVRDDDERHVHNKDPVVVVVEQEDRNFPLPEERHASFDGGGDILPPHVHGGAASWLGDRAVASYWQQSHDDTREEEVVVAVEEEALHYLRHDEDDGNRVVHRELRWKATSVLSEEDHDEELVPASHRRLLPWLLLLLDDGDLRANHDENDDDGNVSLLLLASWFVLHSTKTTTRQDEPRKLSLLQSMMKMRPVSVFFSVVRTVLDSIIF